ncbi:hypothetical protein M0R45_011939 [Rubus argutus]|uniref:Uncharacterized protein n=1 Tax=Rubus argutus TaxID=59490 RepID=A0AAW1YBT4_RUBAR
MASIFVMNLVNSTLDWVTATLDAPSSRAVVFGVPIGGHLFVEVALFAVIVFLLSQKSYKPPKKPLTEKEIDDLCEEWVPEPLIPLSLKRCSMNPQLLAGPTYNSQWQRSCELCCSKLSGLIGHEKLLESCTSALEKYVLVHVVSWVLRNNWV